MAADVIARLTGTTVSPAEAEATPDASASSGGGVPSQPGLYAWWVDPTAVPGVAGPPHPSERRELLYVGIAPSRPASQASLRSRVVGQHLGGNINSSTFRFSLAALLHEQHGWEPIWRGGHPRLTAEDDRRLSAWQERHLRLCWAVRSDPWLVEAEVIAALAPPLNLADNPNHPFRDTLSMAREALRRSALQARGDTARLQYQPPGAAYVVGYDISATPIARNVASRRRESVTRWLDAITTAAQTAAAAASWSVKWRYAAVIEIRIPWDADIDNFLKDTLDRSKDAGVFAGDDGCVDLIHGIKISVASEREAGARVEVWRLS